MKVSNPKTILINAHTQKLNKKYFIPEFKKMTKTFYSELENYDHLILSRYFEGDACYAFPTNKEHNSIQKAIFQQHIHTTHPSITSNEMPPDHTLIIEANISSSVSTKSCQKIDRHLKNRILTSCGDADVMSDTKHIDPTLCLYIGASLICIDNKHMKDRVPRGNRTLCRVLGVKLRENALSHRVKNYYGKEVWTVNAKHVEWVQCEHVNIPGHITA